MKKSFLELSNWLIQHADVEEVQIELLPKSYWDAIMFNILHGYIKNNSKLDLNSLEFVVYRLLDTDKNEVYNQSLKVIHEEFVYVVFEKHTGIISSNCNRLQIELILAQGINHEDLLQKSVAYQTYLTFLHFYQNGEY